MQAVAEPAHLCWAGQLHSPLLSGPIAGGVHVFGFQAEQLQVAHWKRMHRTRARDFLSIRRIRDGVALHASLLKDRGVLFPLFHFISLTSSGFHMSRGASAVLQPLPSQKKPSMHTHQPAYAEPSPRGCFTAGAFHVPTGSFAMLSLSSSQALGFVGSKFLQSYPGQRSEALEFLLRRFSLQRTRREQRRREQQCRSEP